MVGITAATGCLTSVNVWSYVNVWIYQQSRWDKEMIMMIEQGEEREVRQRIAESIIAYSNKHHIKHNANMLCVRCDIAAAYSYAAKIALGEGE